MTQGWDVHTGYRIFVTANETEKKTVIEDTPATAVLRSPHAAYLVCPSFSLANRPLAATRRDGSSICTDSTPPRSDRAATRSSYVRTVHCCTSTYCCSVLHFLRAFAILPATLWNPVSQHSYHTSSSIGITDSAVLCYLRRHSIAGP